MSVEQLSVRVDDSGTGIEARDLRFVGQRHCTSKCTADGDDLPCASGETLARCPCRARPLAMQPLGSDEDPRARSLGEVAVVELTTRHRASADTLVMIIAGGQSCAAKRALLLARAAAPR